MNGLELLNDISPLVIIAVQGYRIWKKDKKLISRNLKQTSINILKMTFGEVFLVHDGIKWMNRKLKASKSSPELLLSK